MLCTLVDALDARQNHAFRQSMAQPYWRAPQSHLRRNPPPTLHPPISHRPRPALVCSIARPPLTVKQKSLPPLHPSFLCRSPISTGLVALQLFRGPRSPSRITARHPLCSLSRAHSLLLSKRAISAPDQTTHPLPAIQGTGAPVELQ